VATTSSRRERSGVKSEEESLDLTLEEPESQQRFAAQDLPDFVRIRNSEDLRANIQEAIRSTVTWLVLGLYAVIEWRLFNAVSNEISLENIDKAAAVLVTPLVGIVGTVLGFYFGNREPSRRR
jgi:hypothetical protein